MSVFDGQAELYDAVRPPYPEQLFDDLVRLTGLGAGQRILEVGAGTGQATRSLSRLGAHIVALEPGPTLADVATSRLAGAPNVRVVATTFEEWPSEPDAFDLVASATAFHWVDPAVAYRKAHECLRAGGWIALFWNRHVRAESTDSFYSDVDEIYHRWAPELAGRFDLPPLEEISGDQRIAESGLFGPVSIRRYGWTETHDSGSYTQLLRTYSDHIELPADRRERLLEEIAHLIRTSFGDRLVLQRGTVLYAAPVSK